MKLTKAREIVVLNLKEANASMPPDVHDALKLHVEAVKRIEEARADGDLFAIPLLKGETNE